MEKILNKIQIPAWLLAVAVLIFLGIILEQLYISKRPVNLWGLKLNQPSITSPTNPSNLHLPIGSIIAWHKSLLNTPNLPHGWVELNGQRINDKDSPYHNLEVPNINDELYSDGRGYYLRGGNESGKFNESTYYTDNNGQYSFVNTGKYYGATYGQYNSLDSDISNVSNYSTNKLGEEIRFQTAAMTVVYIMKIK